MFNIKNSQDFVGGLTMIVAGALFIWFGWDLEFGTSFQMGPGYFPIALSIILILIGVGMLGQSVVMSNDFDEEASAPNWKACVLVVLGPVFFGLALFGLGLAPTVFIMTVVVATASRYARWTHSIALGLFLALCSVVLFTRLLSLPIDAFGPWIPFSS
ncbi:tripartite tricarboxylate transporter TctB family protein [Rhizobium sp. S152]|uniref:tripartite tricarboxylate transporter TctB family protein n=1 Tax=Rhizobium sp. S152 TaxID=3055038 RepID=UPI0025A961EB|nr:tripartite tricarboxylate transporter TctB family protein [Rhizobium sp. S152]MDM9628009.1 tripartite tricarboxylate transporter TctB family protein [Rhizobium sp. S152]